MQQIKTKQLISLSFILMLGLSCATLLQPAAVQAGLFSMSEQQEISAGQQVAAQAEREYGGVLPYNDPRSVRVRNIGAQFARMSSRKRIPYTFKVLNNNQVLNAFAAPGGPIYVTKRLVDVTANDAELAYVLGHETAHIDHKHIVKAVEKQQKVGLGVGILGALIGKGKQGNTINAVTGIAFNLWRNGYSRKDESQADAVGVRWMARMGYDPRAAISMLGKMGGGGGGLSKYLSTHPAPADRQRKVSQLINGENLLGIARRSGGPRLWVNGGRQSTVRTYR